MDRSLSIVIGTVLLVGACAAPTAAVPSLTAPLAVEAAASTSAAPASKTLEITAFDLGFTPATLDVPAPGKYEVRLKNTGATTHDITFASGESATAKPGETVSVMVDIPASGTTFLCSIPGHAAAGMTGGIVVTGSAPSPSHGSQQPRRTRADDRRRGRPQRADAGPVRPDGAEAPCLARSTTSTS